MKNIAIDLDGVLTTETEGHDYINRTPNKEMIFRVNQLKKTGATITIYSSRFEQDRQITEKWLKTHGVEYDRLVLGKIQYDMLIDDKAFNFPSNEESAMRDNLKDQLRYIGEDPTREGLKKTPDRIIKMWNEIFVGYKMNPDDLLTTFSTDGYNQIVLLKNIELYSMCEHHMLPFYGKAHVAYIPGKRVIGISKLARLVDIYARRLQIQERIGDQVTDALMKYLEPQGAACIIEATHMCMRMRGVQKQNSIMVTSSMRGTFLEKQTTRDELMQLIKE